nr:MAG TPA: hypothetical protein [Caudoviricetes sp.]
MARSAFSSCVFTNSNPPFHSILLLGTHLMLKHNLLRVK